MDHLDSRPLAIGGVRRTDGLGWLLGAIRQYDSHAWRDSDLEEVLAEALRIFWLENRESVQANLSAKETFLALLNLLISRQNALAYELRDEVLRAMNT